MNSLFSDKMCDQLSDAVLDAHLEEDCNAKVACGKCCCFVSYCLFYTYSIRNFQ